MKKKSDTAKKRRSEYLGQWLRNRRAQIRRTMRQCSELSGYSEAMISELERGTYDPMGIAVKRIPGLALAYNVRTEAILWRLGIIEPPATNEWTKLKRLMEADGKEKIEDLEEA